MAADGLHPTGQGQTVQRVGKPSRPCIQGLYSKRISEDFQIGFNHKVHACKQASSNVHSALEKPDVIHKYLEKEVTRGRVVGQSDPDLAPPSTQISLFGVIPKSSQPGKRRLIVDLSSQKGKVSMME